MKSKLAIVATHPIQYYSPWFRFIAQQRALALRVFYLWDFGVEERFDPGFREALRWDVPLLAGYDHEFVPNRSAKPGTDRFFGLRNPQLARRLRAYEPDAVLLLGYNYASLLKLILTWPRACAPLLFRGDSHRIGKRAGLGEALRRAFIKHVFARFSAVLFVGRANLDYFRYHGVDENRLFASPHAVDNERFFAARREAEIAAVQWKRELGIPEGDLVILFAGKWESKKRPLDLLQAFVGLRRSDVSLLFVGAGPLAPVLRQAAAGESKVFVAGFQNQTLMPRTYSAGDLFVLPSVSDTETWGLAVNEAMCMARAVVVSDRVGCAPDLVRPYVNGLVFRAGDVAALEAALREALSDRERLRAWGDEGREIVRRFDYAAATAGLMAALGRPQPNPAGA